ncbi:MAG: hypothetical protein ACJ76N_11405 [Thermoanaerobaculia bacterium]
MTLAETTYRHIVLDDNGFSIINGANIKIVELVAEVQTHGLSPEELCYQLSHLSLDQVYSAFACYWDHKEEVDRDLERRAQLAEELRRELSQPPLVAKLKQRALFEGRSNQPR